MENTERFYTKVGKVKRHMRKGKNKVAVVREHSRKPKLGSGKRFAKLEGKLSHEKGVTDPGALAAAIGRKKFGAKKFNSLAKHGKHVKRSNFVPSPSVG